jgi:hypothetical protein
MSFVEKNVQKQAPQTKVVSLKARAGLLLQARMT